jgi:hypothetical protein
MKYFFTLILFLDILMVDLVAQSALKLTDGATIFIQSGASLSAEGDLSIDNNANLENKGTITLQNAQLQNNGTYKGNGTLNSFSFVNNGTIAPGANATTGTLTFNTNFTTTNVVSIKINSATDFDKIVVMGNAAIGGTLSINFGSYTPPSGQTFQIITASGFSGSFATLNIIPNTVPTTYENGILSIVSALPVELVDFSAKKESEYVRLNWQTTSESKNKGFEIHRSTDGHDWQVLYFEKGFGTSTIAHKYSFLDKNPSSNLLYYRLKQIDFDEKSTFSNIVTVQLGREISVALYPNPVKGEEVTLILQDDLSEPINLSIFNAAGQLIGTKTIVNGVNRLNMSEFPTGLYWLKGVNKDLFFSKKVVVQQ